MKKFILKLTNLDHDPHFDSEQDEHASYATLISIVCAHPLREGFKSEEVINRNRITKAVDKVIDNARGEDGKIKFPIEMEFEDSDAKNLQEILRDHMRWGTANSDIAEFIEDVEAIPKSS